MRPAKILCAAFALACAGSTPACAWFGKSPENLEEPAAPAAAPAASSASGARALLWVPDPRKLDWEGLRGLLEREEAARFTLALAPEDIPEAAQLWLAQAVQEGRLEVALRLAGDPILPLAASTQNPWIFERLASSRQSLSRILGRPPSGFVPGRGAASPEVAAALAAQGFSWIAVGRTEEAAPWTDAKGLAFLPFSVLESSAVGEGFVAEAAASLLAERGQASWRPARDWASDSSPSPGEPEQWVPFTGSLSHWDSTPLQKQSWRLFQAAADAVQAYQNSGSASLMILDRANQALFAASASRFFTGAVRSPAADREFREHLRRVFRLIRRRPPPELAAPAAAAPTAPDAGGEPGARSPGEGLRTGSAKNSLWFDASNDLAPGTTAQDLWTPKRLRITWTEKTVTFAVTMSRLEGSASAPNGFGGLLCDIYIDLNHLARRGASELMPGRKAFLKSIDAWEFALVVTGWNAGFYRSEPGQPPSLLESLKADSDVITNELRVQVPRRLLRGNPTGWGYLVAAMGTDRPLAQARPPQPAPQADGQPILGLLTTREELQRLRSPDAAARMAFSALRLKTEAY